MTLQNCRIGHSEATAVVRLGQQPR